MKGDKIAVWLAESQIKVNYIFFPREINFTYKLILFFHEIIFTKFFSFFLANRHVHWHHYQIPIGLGFTPGFRSTPRFYEQKFVRYSS